MRSRQVFLESIAPDRKPAYPLYAIGFRTPPPPLFALTAIAKWTRVYIYEYFPPSNWRRHIVERCLQPFLFIPFRREEKILPRVEGWRRIKHGTEARLEQVSVWEKWRIRNGYCTSRPVLLVTDFLRATYTGWLVAGQTFIDGSLLLVYRVIPTNLRAHTRVSRNVSQISTAENFFISAESSVKMEDIEE